MYVRSLRILRLFRPSLAAMRRKEAPISHPGSYPHDHLHGDGSGTSKKQRVGNPHEHQQLPYMFAPLQDTSLGLLPQQYLPHPFMMQTSMNGMMGLDHATMMQHAGQYPKQNAPNLMYATMPPMDAYAMRPEHHMNMMHQQQLQQPQQQQQPVQVAADNNVGNSDQSQGVADDHSKKYAAVGAFGEAEDSESDHH